ncbi:MAG: hypothetical protein ORN26_00905 [Candidatus Pacebacteria bacterium]|nr:hypothetical protein [Candidatus Paceibacterota bacterium]
MLGNNLINIAVQNISSYKENIRDVRDLYSTKEEFKDMSYKVLMSTVFYDGEIIDYGETYTKDKPFY